MKSNMKIRIVIVGLIFLLVGIIIYLLFSNFNTREKSLISPGSPQINNLEDLVILTGKPIDLGNYTYTTAICNSGNSCIDVKIECSNGEVVNMEPISDLRFFGDDWKDEREKKTDFC